MKLRNIMSIAVALLLCMIFAACEKSGEATVTEESVTETQSVITEEVPDKNEALNDKFNLQITHDTSNFMSRLNYPYSFMTDEGIVFQATESGWAILGYEGDNTELVIPRLINGVEVICISGDFLNSEIRTLYIPDTVTTVDSGVFSTCSNLENIFISEENKNFIITDNLVLSGDGKGVISYYGSKSEVVIPDGVTVIGEEAFSCSDITSVKFPEGLEVIGKAAFNSSDITSATFPEGLEVIGDMAFLYCSALSDVQFPDTLTYIGDCAFQSSKSLTEISLKSDGNLRIKEQAFFGCTNIKKITLENINLICRMAFDCENTEEITINGSLDRLEFDAFYISWLKDSTAVINLPDDFGGFKRSKYKFSIMPYIYKGERMNESAIAAVMAAPELGEDFDIRMNETGGIGIVSYKGSDTVVDLRKYKTEVPVTELSYPAFKGNDKITSVTLCDSVLRVGSQTFLGCSSLESLTLSKELNSMDFKQLKTCESLKEIIIPEENNKYTYRDGMFFSKDLKTLYYVMGDYTEFTVPETVKHIHSSAFCGLLNLRKLVITKSVEELPSGIFVYYFDYYDTENYYYPEDLPIKEIVIEGNTYMGNDIYVPDGCKKITISEENKHHTVVDEVLFSKDMKTLYWCPDTKTEYIVPDGVVHIADRAFWDNKKLKNITFPDSLISIGSSAFGSTSLEEVIFPENLISINAYAFYNCKSLSKVQFNENLEVIGFGALYNCPLTGVVTIPDSVEYITMIFLGDPDSSDEFIIPEYSFSYRGNTYTAEEIMEYEGFEWN